jgi:ABC-type lipoprotein release transport system permease subunit
MILFLRLAWRNIWRHRRRTLIVILSIGMTMAMMMWYDGTMSGFEQSIYANAIKVLGGNIQVHADGYKAKADQTPLLALQNDQQIITSAETLPEVVAASRRINTGGMATSREGAFPVSIVGIEPEKELPVSLSAQHVVDGRFLQAGDLDMIFIGKGLADAMDVKVGDRVTMVGRALHEQMRRRTMTVVGIFDVGMKDIEKRTIYVTLAEAQDLYGLTGKSTEVAISLQALGQESTVMTAMKPGLSGYEMASWQTNFPELQAAVNSKNGVMDIFNVIILVIVGIGILNLLMMAVYERTREIGLLGALGLRPGQISTLFILEGAMMGAVGVVLGIALGLLLNAILGQVGMDYSQFTGVTSYTALLNGRIYPSLGLEKIGQRVLTVLIISILAAYSPAREAARREPAEALHFV